MGQEGETGFWVDHTEMMIDMNIHSLRTLEQIREFLAGTPERDPFAGSLRKRRGT